VITWQGVGFQARLRWWVLPSRNIQSMSGSQTGKTLVAVPKPLPALFAAFTGFQPQGFVCHFRTCFSWKWKWDAESPGVYQFPWAYEGSAVKGRRARVGQLQVSCWQQKEFFRQKWHMLPRG
jgi:hypothetical protein